MLIYYGNNFEEFKRIRSAKNLSGFFGLNVEFRNNPPKKSGDYVFN
jgi:hypothetical protein